MIFVIFAAPPAYFRCRLAKYSSLPCAKIRNNLNLRVMENKRSYLEYALQPRRFNRFPLAWPEIFSREAPLAVEIGFGNGEFLVNWARQVPEWDFIGFEISMASMERALKRLQQQQIFNARPVHQDARFGLREFFADEAISHVMMNFPDPWPKERHQRRRLLDPDFVNILAAVLKTGGCYELVTDQEWYAAHAHSLFRESPHFRVEALERNPRRPVTTKYEKKWRELGRSSYRVLARKQTAGKINRLLEDVSMPHRFIDSEINAEDIELLAGLEYIENERVFVVKSLYRALSRTHYLLYVVAKDAAYKQDFYISVARQDDGRWLVKLDPSVQPYRTPAVKAAVWEIGRRLAETAGNRAAQ